MRSNGTVTYVGKDIAYQLWKFGLLGKDFYYRLWSIYPTAIFCGPPASPRLHPPQTAVRTAISATPARSSTSSDSRQAYLQDVVVAGLRALNFQEQADASIHFSYEMVALSPRTCVEMGLSTLRRRQNAPTLRSPARKGLGVKADDLIDKLIATALAEVEHRHPESSPEDREKTARQIAVGALRYFMLKFTRNSVIAFRFS